MITHLTTANHYAGETGRVPDVRAALSSRLQELEPERPIALAAHLNGTPTLTSLDQLSTGEATAMLERLALPTYALASWQAAQEQPEPDGAGWLR